MSGPLRSQLEVNNQLDAAFGASPHPADRVPVNRKFRIARNTMWSFLGAGIPIFLALLAYPMLLQGMGMERFAILTVIWTIINFASYFELGISRELIRRVAIAYTEHLNSATDNTASRRGIADDVELSKSVWTALFAQTILGAVAGLILHCFGPSLLLGTNTVPEYLHAELRLTFTIAGLSAPIIFLSLALRGILAGIERFDLISIIGIPTSGLTYFAPLLVLPFSQTLPAAVAAILVFRAVITTVSAAVVLAIFAPLRTFTLPSYVVLREFIQRGSWITITCLIIPLLALFDRIMIARHGSLADVTLYSTAYEGISRIWIFSGSLLGTVSPIMSGIGLHRPGELKHISKRTADILTVLAFPIICGLVIYGQNLMSLWLGADIGVPTAKIMRWLAIGAFAVLMAQVPTTMMSSIGRPDVPGRFHLISLPLSFLLTFWAVRHYGPEGAAIVWMTRAILDALFMYAAAQRLLRTTGRESPAHVGLVGKEDCRIHPASAKTFDPAEKDVQHKPGRSPEQTSRHVPRTILAKFHYPIMISCFLGYSWMLTSLAFTKSLESRVLFGSLLYIAAGAWVWQLLLTKHDRSLICETLFYPLRHFREN